MDNSSSSLKLWRTGLNFIYFWRNCYLRFAWGVGGVFPKGLLVRLLRSYWLMECFQSSRLFWSGAKSINKINYHLFIIYSLIFIVVDPLIPLHLQRKYWRLSFFMRMDKFLLLLLIIFLLFYYFNACKIFFSF